MPRKGRSRPKKRKPAKKKKKKRIHVMGAAGARGAHGAMARSHARRGNRMMARMHVRMAARSKGRRKARRHNRVVHMRHRRKVHNNNNNKNIVVTNEDGVQYKNILGKMSDSVRVIILPKTIVQIDSTGDGIKDAKAIAVDINGDNVPDRYYRLVDTTGDGKEDHLKSMIGDQLVCEFGPLSMIVTYELDTSNPEQPRPQLVMACITDETYAKTKSSKLCGSCGYVAQNEDMFCRRCGSDIGQQSNNIGEVNSVEEVYEPGEEKDENSNDNNVTLQKIVDAIEKWAEDYLSQINNCYLEDVDLSIEKIKIGNYEWNLGVFGNNNNNIENAASDGGDVLPEMGKWQLPPNMDLIELLKQNQNLLYFEGDTTIRMQVRQCCTIL